MICFRLLMKDFEEHYVQVESEAEMLEILECREWVHSVTRVVLKVKNIEKVYGFNWR